MRPRPAAEHALRAEINVTPLVDVCLVLLIIFMVVTPMLRRIAVAVPETARPVAMPERRAQLTVSIRQDAAVYVGAERVPAAALPAALRQIHAATPDREIVIQADHRLAYREVRQVMRAINEAEFTRVGLVAEKKKP